MASVDEARARRVNAGMFRRRYAPAIAHGIIAGGFWSEGGAQALRAVVGQTVHPAPRRLSRPDVDHQRRVRHAVPALRRRVSRSAARDARRVRIAGRRRTWPTSTGRPPSRRRSGRFARSLEPARLRGARDALRRRSFRAVNEADGPPVYCLGRPAHADVRFDCASAKAVFPAAGWGTRFLPATKAQPKEMLPLVDKPIIQYAVEEAVAAGIEQVIIVTSSQKRAIEDHFDLS